MRRRALLSGLLVGGFAVLSRALGIGPVLDLPLEPEEPEEGEAPSEPQPSEPPPSLPPSPEPDDEDEDEPSTEPA